MSLTSPQKVTIACFAVFACLILLLFVLCCYSSRRARRAERKAQKDIHGRWKEISNLEFGVGAGSGTKEGSGGGSGRGKGNVPPVPRVPDHLKGNIAGKGAGGHQSRGGDAEVMWNKESLITQNSVKSGYSRRGSGMAGVGTMTYKTSMKRKGSKSASSPDQSQPNHGYGTATGSKRSASSAELNSNTGGTRGQLRSEIQGKPRYQPPSRGQYPKHNQAAPRGVGTGMGPRGDSLAAGLIRGQSHSTGLPPLHSNGIVRAGSDGRRRTNGERRGQTDLGYGGGHTRSRSRSSQDLERQRSRDRTERKKEKVRGSGRERDREKAGKRREGSKRV